MFVRKVTIRTVLLLSLTLLSSTSLAISDANTGNVKPLIETDSSSSTPLNFLNKAAQSFSLFGNDPADELLPAEEAFSFLTTVKDSNTVLLHWQTAQGYYLYKDKVSVTVVKPLSDDIQLIAISFPAGKEKHDETFGDSTVYYGNLTLQQKLSRTSTEATNITLTIGFQGCADIGVCYPPMKQTVTLQLPNTNSSNLSASSTIDSGDTLSEQDQIAQSLSSNSIWLTSLSFLGFGLLLAFTPCVFPMIPILSGIIIGHGDKITTRKAFMLSLSYVIASALTYTVFGVLAGLFGSNLQASFQNPWIIGSFSLLFVALSLSMFGLYQLQLPSGLQNKLSQLNPKSGKSSYINSGIMGALSALIVGPCVAAPLAGALIYIGQTGDATLGGFALFSLGIGMGIPLVIIGTSAGKLLPKAGHWMEPVKAVFGVLLLAVAIWLLERIIPATATLLLWAALFIISAIYLRAIKPDEQLSGWQKLQKGLGTVFLIYGIVLVLGAASGGTNPMQPLANLNLGNNSNQQTSTLHFQRIKTLDELKRILVQTSGNQQTVMLDFYADWCVSCKEMEHFTFTDSSVQSALRSTRLIQVDVTKNNDNDRTLLKEFGLIGPPAILFFKPEFGEQRSKRVIGFMNAERFNKHLQNTLK